MNKTRIGLNEAGSLASIVALILYLAGIIFSWPVSSQVLLTVLAAGLMLFVIVIIRVAPQLAVAQDWKKGLLPTFFVLGIAWSCLLGIQVEAMFLREERVISYEGPANKLAPLAWDALTAKNYPLALSLTDVCIVSFRPAAINAQRDLNLHGKPQPPTSAVRDEVANEIFSYGALNDVGACYWIRGQSFEGIGRTNDAKASYREAQQFPHARVIDPTQNIFWSPAELATQRLAKLE